MKDFYCLEIRFNEEIIENSTWFHCHLKIAKNEIELKVYYSDKIELSRKYFEWSSKVKDWNKLSLHSEFKISSSEKDLGEIDKNGNYCLSIF